MKTRKDFKFLLGFLLWGIGLFLFFLKGNCVVVFSMYEPWLEEIGRLIVSFSSLWFIFMLIGIVLMFLGRPKYIKKIYNIIFLILSAFIVLFSVLVFLSSSLSNTLAEGLIFSSPIPNLKSMGLQAELYYDKHNNSYVGFTDDPHVVEQYLGPLRKWWKQKKDYNSERIQPPEKKICRGEDYSLKYYESKNGKAVAAEYWTFTSQGAEHNILCIDDTGVYDNRWPTKINQLPTGEKCVE